MASRPGVPGVARWGGHLTPDGTLRSMLQGHADTPPRRASLRLLETCSTRWPRTSASGPWPAWVEVFLARVSLVGGASG